MTLQYFKKLNRKQQRRALLQKGIFMADRTTESFSVFLFLMGDFFVELFFLREDDEIAGIKTSSRVRALKSYKPKRRPLELAN